MMTPLKGFLERWNDEKGFGFIYHLDYPKGVFIHISAFKRGISRRPLVGDIIFYELVVDADGKNKAVNAWIEGVSLVTENLRKSRKNIHSNRRPLVLSRVIALAARQIILIALAVLAFNKYQVRETKHSSPEVMNKDVSVPLATPPQPKYSCQGKTYCSQMSSCEEAQFYQSHCSGTKMDGDNDGIPCEDQWCGH